MLMEDELFEIRRYEVYTLINDTKTTLITTNNINIAKEYYNALVNDSITNYNKNRDIYAIFDYDKNTNIEYYDSKTDV